MKERVVLYLLYKIKKKYRGSLILPRRKRNHCRYHWYFHCSQKKNYYIPLKKDTSKSKELDKEAAAIMKGQFTMIFRGVGSITFTKLKSSQLIQLVFKVNAFLQCCSIYY